MAPRTCAGSPSAIIRSHSDCRPADRRRLRHGHLPDRRWHPLPRPGDRDPDSSGDLDGGAQPSEGRHPRPKPLVPLRELKVHIDLQAPAPNTWRELLGNLDANLPVNGLRVALQEYGKVNPELVEGLEQRGASVTRVPVYRWALPRTPSRCVKPSKKSRPAKSARCCSPQPSRSSICSRSLPKWVERRRSVPP